MKLWKKLTALVMALGMTVAMVACGGDKDGDNSSSVSSSQAAASGQLSKKEIAAAKQKAANATNFTIQAKRSMEVEGEVVVMEYTQKVAGDKVYIEGTRTVDGTSQEFYQYFGKVDEKTYQWMSEDNETWVSMEYVASATEQNPFEALSETDLNYMDDATHAAEYDEEEGCHIFTHMNVVVKVTIVNGDIVKYRFDTAANVWHEYTISYGNTTVGDLPALSE